MTAIAITASLVGMNMAVKVMAILKMLKINTEGLTKKDFEELLNDPQFRKYFR